MGSIYRPKYKDKNTGEYLESAIWWVKYYVHGRARRESTETADFAQAKDFLKQREGEAASGLLLPKSARRVSFGELAADVANDYRINGLRSIEDLRIRFDQHILPVLRVQTIQHRERRRSFRRS